MPITLKIKNTFKTFQVFLSQILNLIFVFTFMLLPVKIIGKMVHLIDLKIMVLRIIRKKREELALDKFKSLCKYFQ